MKTTCDWIGPAVETRLESRRESGNQEDHDRATDFKGMSMSGTLLHDVQLHQHSIRDAYRFRLTHLVRLGRLGLWVCSGLWFVVHECRECRFGLRDEPWTDIGANSHTWSDLACFGSGSAVGSGFGSLAGKGTGSGFVAGVRRREEGLGREGCNVTILSCLV